MITFTKAPKEDLYMRLCDCVHKTGNTYINTLGTRVYMDVPSNNVVVFELVSGAGPYLMSEASIVELVRPINLKIVIVG